MELLLRHSYQIWCKARRYLSQYRVNLVQNKSHISCCLLCQKNLNEAFNIADEYIPLCQYCYQDLPLFHPQITNLLSFPNIHQKISHQHIDTLLSLSPYQWPINHWLHQLKYNQAFELAPLFASLLTKHLTQGGNNFTEHLIACTPMHIKRWQERGYNQSHLITKCLANQLAIPYYADLLIRLEHTAKQVGLSGVQRRKNIRQAFTVNEQYKELVKHKHWILLDDVLTTGTTANQMAKLLKQHAAKSVTVITVALALHQAKQTNNQNNSQI